MTEGEALAKRIRIKEVLDYVASARGHKHTLEHLSKDTCDLNDQCQVMLTLGVGSIGYRFYIEGPAYVQRIYEIIKQAVGTETLNANNLLEGLDK